MQSFDKGRFLTAEMVEKLGTVEIEPFSWANLGSDEMLVPDNPRRSVILAGLHEKRELEQKVSIPREFDETIGAKSRPLFPIDMTEDYRRSQEEVLFKKKRKMLDEDEAVALELAEAIKGGKHPLQSPGRWKKGGEGERSAGTKDDSAATEEQGSAKQDEKIVRSVEGQISKKAVPELRDSSRREISETATEMADARQGLAPEFVNSEALAEMREAARSEGYAVGLEEGRQAGAAEVEAARAEGHEQGQQKGYDEGFRVGEERGEIAGEAKVQNTLTMLNEVVHQIDLVRSEILSSGQEIFLEFAKVACESILRGQLMVHDETLRLFMKQTLTPFVERSFITLEVSQGMGSKVTALLVDMGDLQRKVRVKESSAMPEGDFRVEADNEVVIVDLKKAVESLLETVKGEILSEPTATGAKSGKGAA
jgi:flagellar biosynthesis/type III secretory pathway protein FliH